MSDLYVDAKCNPKGVDSTLNQMGAALIQNSDGSYLLENGCYVMRILGDPGYVRFACEHQGYCRIIGERPVRQEQP